MEDVFTQFQEHFWAGEFEAVDRMLEDFDVEKHQSIQCVAMVRGSFAAREKLKQWISLRDRVHAHLEAIGEDADHKLRGLYSDN